MRVDLLSAILGTAFLCSALFSGIIHAQGRDSEQQSEAAQQETRKTPAMRERVYSRLSEAQACADEGDMPCARELLDRVREMSNLNSYEIAQMWNFYAFIYFSQDNYREAIRAYENVLQQADLPLGLETTTIFTLTQLYFQEERFEDSLAMLERWFVLTPTPAPDPYVLKAQIYYSLERFREGIEPVRTAIQVAMDQERELRENWYRLLNVFYYELEEYPNVISVLTTMIEMWPKREYFIQLSAMYGQEGDEGRQLALFETAYEAGWLLRSSEIVNLSQLLLQADIPYKAAKILEKGLEDGIVESTESNWRVLAQAWQLAQEDEEAIPALSRAAGLADDGVLDIRLAQSHQNLAQWQSCVDAARSGMRKGDLRRPDQANMILGACLFELGEFDAARNAFGDAEKDSRSRTGARSWMRYVDAEEDRERQLEQALRRG